MKEKDLFNFWKNSVKSGAILKLKDFKGKDFLVKLIYKGELYSNFGPDIQNTKIEYNNRVYTGDIEFHINSIDWFRHNHHTNVRYNNVILHIVNNHNSKIRIINSKGKRIKTLIIDKLYINSTIKFHLSNYSLPCHYLILREQNKYIINDLLINLGLYNFKSRVDFILDLYKKYSNKFSNIDIFNQLSFVLIFRGLGYYYNRDIFQKMIINIDYNNNIALLSEYLNNFDFIHYGRPNNSPKRRIYQFLKFIKNSKFNIFHNILSSFEKSFTFLDFSNRVLKMFNKNNDKLKISLSRIKIIVYNLILPLLNIYFVLNKKKKYQTKILKYYLDTDNFEDNKVLRLIYDNLELKISKAVCSQGLYYLYQKYCKSKKCINCYIYKNLK